MKPSGSRAAAREWYRLDDIRGLRDEVGAIITTKMPTKEQKKILRKVHDSRMEALKAREEVWSHMFYICGIVVLIRRS